MPTEAASSKNYSITLVFHGERDAVSAEAAIAGLRASLANGTGGASLTGAIATPSDEIRARGSEGGNEVRQVVLSEPYENQTLTDEQTRAQDLYGRLIDLGESVLDTVNFVRRMFPELPESFLSWLTQEWTEERHAVVLLPARLAAQANGAIHVIGTFRERWEAEDYIWTLTDEGETGSLDVSPEESGATTVAVVATIARRREDIV